MNLRRWLTLGAATVVAASLVGCGEDSPAGDPYEEGVPFLVDFTAARVDGGQITLESLEGKVVLVHLFGTWCRACRRSAPVLVSLHERYRDLGFEVVGLAYERSRDLDEVKEAVLAFKREFGIPYILAVGTEDLWRSPMPHQLRGVVPVMLLVDRQGVVRRHFESFLPGREAVLAEEIERLLAEPAVRVPRVG